VKFGGFEAGRPPNGAQAHDLSRELEFVSPAQVGATPFGDRAASKPYTQKHSGHRKNNNKQLTTRPESVTHVLS
jgi:hypothetical protein